MTATELVTVLNTAGVPAYETAAPAGVGRYCVVNPYAVSSIPGDDSVLTEIEKVQLDIVCYSKLDTIVSDVKAVLVADWIAWETMTPLSYDPEFNALRCILTAELA